MSASVGSLVVKISASAANLAAGLNAARSNVGSFGKSLESAGAKGKEAFNWLQAGGMLAAGATAFNALKNATVGFLEEFDKIDELGDFAEEIGASVESVQSLRFAAEKLGASADDLDAGLKKLNIRLGQARAGSKSAQAAFAALGLNAQQLATIDLDEAFRAIAQAISEIENPSDRAAAAVEMFGKAGAGLNNILKHSAREIAELQRLAESTGQVLSTDQVNAASAAAQAMKELALAWKNAKNALAAQFGPALAKTAEALTSIIGAFNKVTSSIDQNVVKIGVFAASFVTFLAIIPKVISAVKSITLAIQSFAKAQAIALAFGGPKGWAILAASVAAAAAATYAISKAFEEAEAKTENNSASTADKAADAVERIEELKRKGESLAQGLRNPWEIYSDTIAETQELLAANAITWATYSRAVKAAAKELQEATEAEKKVREFKPQAGVGAAAAGTSAGFSAVQAGLRAQTELARWQREQAVRELIEQQKQTILLQRIRDALESGRSLPAVKI